MHGSIVGLAIGGVLLALLGVGLARIRWWLSLVPFLLLALWNLALLDEMNEKFYGASRVSSMGYSRAILMLTSLNIPFFLSIPWIARLRLDGIRTRRLRKGQCIQCGYPSAGPLCPECGEPTQISP